VEESGVDVECGEADAGDAEGVAFAETGGEAGGGDGDAVDAAVLVEADEGSGLFDDAGEHLLILRDWGTEGLRDGGTREQSIGNREQGTGNREQGTGNREQGTGNREQGRGNREQATGNRQ